MPLDRSAAPGREFRDASLNCAAKKFAHRLGRLKSPRGATRDMKRGKRERERGREEGKRMKKRERETQSKRRWRGDSFLPPPLFPRFKDGSPLAPPSGFPSPRMDSARRWLLDSRPIAATYSYRPPVSTSNGLLPSAGPSCPHPLVTIRSFGHFTMHSP